MPRISFALLAAVFLTSVVHAAPPVGAGQVTPVPVTPEAVMPVPAPPSIAARAYLLMDYDSGYVIAGDNIDMPVEPASITKLMTTYIVYSMIKSGRLTMDTPVTISEKAWRMGGSKMFVKVGNQVKVGDLLKGVIIQSGNDAAIALAENIAGSEDTFVNMMNHQAQRLGMTSTRFANATGWPDPNHYSTARDIATLMRAMIRDFPEFYALEREKEFVWNNIRQINRNRLLWRDPSVDGGKTGHTESAGYCLVASAKREGMRLISVVMGAASEQARTEQSLALLNYGFRFYETRLLRKAGDVLVEPRVWKGASKTVRLGLANDLYVTAQRGQFEHLDVSVELPPRLDAPLRKGQVVGTLRVRSNGQLISEAPVVALDEVAQGGLIRRISDSILLMFG